MAVSAANDEDERTWAWGDLLTMVPFEVGADYVAARVQIGWMAMIRVDVKGHPDDAYAMPLDRGLAALRSSGRERIANTIDEGAIDDDMFWLVVTHGTEACLIQWPHGAKRRINSKGGEC